MNLVQLCGNLGKDFEIQSFQKSNGETFIVAKNSLAITQKFISKDEKGDKVTKEHTDWIPITLFGKNAENASKFFQKGSKFLCEGKITTNSYNDETGQTKYGWGIEVRKYYFTQQKENNAQNKAQALPEIPKELDDVNTAINNELIENAVETQQDETQVF